ncbi:MAG: hypothetical protein IT427_07425 [Pirellulales bacterium]|nr:hypothetical protein [Pirellulales bacterium]
MNDWNPSLWNGAMQSIDPNIPARSVKARSCRRISPRRGIAIVAAIVALTVASVMLFYLLKGTIETQRQMRSHRQEVQADWLAAAGIDRAIAQLRQSANYAGETWRIPPEQIGDTATAEVIIKVEPAADSSDKQISVQADYPVDTPFRARKTRNGRWAADGKR